MTGMNKYVLRLSRWWANLSRRRQLIGRIVFCELLGFVCFYGYHFILELNSGFAWQTLFTAVFVLLVFMPPTRFATIAVSEYFQLDELHVLIKMANAELQDAHAELLAKNIELQEANVKLQKTSIVDPLTGAYNRVFLPKARLITLSDAVRNECSLVCIIIDIDRFKNINDAYGYLVGDLVLKESGRKLIDLFRKSDIVVRYGGDEFNVLAYTKNVKALIQKIVSHFQYLEILYVDEKSEEMTLVVTYSFGYACIDSFESEKDFMTKLLTDEDVERIHEGIFKKANEKLKLVKESKNIKR